MNTLPDGQVATSPNLLHDRRDEPSSPLVSRSTLNILLKFNKMLVSLHRLRADSISLFKIDEDLTASNGQGSLPLVVIIEALDESPIITRDVILGEESVESVSVGLSGHQSLLYSLTIIPQAERKVKRKVRATGQKVSGSRKVSDFSNLHSRDVA